MAEEIKEVQAEVVEEQPKRRLRLKSWHLGVILGLAVVVVIVYAFAALMPVKMAQMMSPSGVLITRDAATGFTTMSPKTATPAYADFAKAVSGKAKSLGFDGLLVGRIYTGADGTLRWSDYAGGSECSAGSILGSMQSLGLTNVLALVDNPDGRTLGYPVTEQSRGALDIREKDIRFAWILWKTGERKIVFASNNLSGQVRGGQAELSIDGLTARKAAKASMLPIPPQEEKKETKMDKAVTKAALFLLSW